VVVIGVVIAAIGLGLAIVGMFAPAPPQVSTLGWVLLAIGIVLIIAGLVLNAVDDNTRAAVDQLARSSWGKTAAVLAVPGLRKRWRASWGGPEA
jgi:sulfite exporter TauE/SafE